MMKERTVKIINDLLTGNGLLRNCDIFHDLRMNAYRERKNEINTG